MRNLSYRSKYLIGVCEVCPPTITVCRRSVPTYYHLFVGDPPPQNARADQRSRIFAPYQSLSREIGDFQI